MGALTNRKRGGDFLNLLPRHPHINSPDVQSSKRLKYSSKYQGKDSLSSTSSRVLKYPEISTRPGRELHAPVRPPKFGLCSDRENRATARIRVFEREDYAPYEIGNGHVGANQMPERNAFCVSSYVTEGKELIDLADDETQERQNNVVFADSSIEEMDPPSGRNRLKAVDMGAANLQGSVVSELSEGDALGVENAGNMSVSPSVEKPEESTVLSLLAYKKLLREALGRDAKIREIDFNKKLCEERLSFLQLGRPKKTQQEIPREPFLPLTEEEEMEVSRALSGNRRKVLVVHKNSNIEISGETLQCLKPFAWLNDEVINLYLELLKERENREPNKFLKCHFFNTFFYKKLIGGGKGGYDYKSVRRWTTQRKLGYSLIDCDKIFVPIHQEIHWCLAVINKKEKKFQYLDSLRGKDSQVLKVLARYFTDEVTDKSGKDIDVRSWQQEYVEDLPEQENGYDCGMFMIKYADFYSRGLSLCFNQEHMPYFRVRTTKEILKLRAD